MAKKCPNCGNENPNAAKFCMFCQTQIIGESELSETDKLRKQLADAKEQLEKEKRIKELEEHNKELKKKFENGTIQQQQSVLQTTQEQVDVVELFDNNGDSYAFEVLSTIAYKGNSYLVLTPFVQDESEIDLTIPAEIFVMHEVVKNGNERMLEPVADEFLVEKIFSKFKEEAKGKYDFAGENTVSKTKPINYVSENNGILQEKRQEAENLLLQVEPRLKGQSLNDIQKQKLANAANRLNSVCKSNDIAAIDDAIAWVKSLIPPPTKPPRPRKTFLWIVILGAIFAIAMNLNNIISFFQDNITDNSQKYTTSKFSVYGNAESNNSYVGNIDSKSGFRFTVNSDSKTSAKLSLKYQCDKRGGILKVNDEVQYLYFPSLSGNWGTKEVIARLEQGANTIEFCGGWLTDFAPDIADIKVVPDNNIIKKDIVGVWKGTYIENRTTGVGSLTLTINDDMKGIIKTTISKRKPHQQLIKAYYTVSVTASNGVYYILGKEWIVQPDEYGFDNFEGTLSNGIFKGENFSFEKISTKMESTNAVFPFKGNWELTGKDSYNNWIADFVIDEKKGNNFSGYFDWYCSGNYRGREYYRGEYNPQNSTVTLKGYKLSNSKNLALGTYRANFNGNNFDSGTWGGAGTTSGTWYAVLLNNYKK